MDIAILARQRPVAKKHNESAGQASGIWGTAQPRRLGARKCAPRHGLALLAEMNGNECSECRSTLVLVLLLPVTQSLVRDRSGSRPFCRR